MLKISPSLLLFELIKTRWHFRLAIIVASFFSAFFGLLSPIFQKEFIDNLTGQASSLPHINITAFGSATPFAYIALAFVCLLLALAFSVLATFLGTYESTKMQRIWADRLYQKILHLRQDTLGQRQTGELVSIYATDVPGATILLEQSLPMGANILFPLILGPLAIILIFKLPIAPVVALILTLVLLNALLAYRQSLFFFKFKKLAADRIGLVSEWIQNIRALRILNWISSFEERIFAVRRVETENRVGMVTNGQLMNSIASSITFVLNILAIIAVVYFAHVEITPGMLLALLWIVAIFLTRPFRALPWFFTFLFDSWTSLKRLSAVLSLDNKDPIVRPKSPLKLNPLGVDDLAIDIDHLNLKLKNRTLLKNISLQIKQKEFVALVGEVGSGKTLLLLSLMGETGATTKKYNIGKNNTKDMPLEQLRNFFSFVPQEGFIMSASLRENICFEYAPQKNQDDYLNECLRASQIDLSQEGTPLSLDTEIGERGVNLSGGQKQRVNLARVRAAAANILLLDDCLSALDVDTEKNLISQLLLGDWADKTRILVTHRLSVLESVDRIIFIQGGEIKCEGTLTDLVKRSPEFAKYISTVEEEGPDV